MNLVPLHDAQWFPLDTIEPEKGEMRLPDTSALVKRTTGLQIVSIPRELGHLSQLLLGEGKAVKSIPLLNPEEVPAHHSVGKCTVADTFLIAVQSICGRVAEDSGSGALVK